MNESSLEQYQGYIIELVTTPVYGGYEARFTIKRAGPSSLSVTKIIPGVHSSRDQAELAAIAVARKAVDGLKGAISNG